MNFLRLLRTHKSSPEELHSRGSSPAHLRREEDPPTPGSCVAHALLGATIIGLSFFLRAYSGISFARSS